MTEQEGEIWASRLTRIWVSTEPVHWEIEPKLRRFSFECRLTQEIKLEIYQSCGLEHFDLDRIENFAEEGQQRTGMLSCYLDEPKTEINIHVPGIKRQRWLQNRCLQFAEEWLPFFRRGCWLSGCDIEASAHEKAEWMQGFSREELEAWNLKV